MNIEVIAKTAVQNLGHTPILFIHGAWHGAWCWEYFQIFFAEKGYSSYALSLRGHGGSEGRERLRWYRASDYVDDIAQTVGQLPGPPILIGHSMGGYLVQKYLERYSAPGVVLMASAPVRGSLKMFLRLGLKHPWQMVKCHLTWNSYAPIETPELAQYALFSADMPENVLDQHFIRLQSESYRIGWDTVVFDLPQISIF